MDSLMLDFAICVLVVEVVAFASIPRLRRMIPLSSLLPNIAAGLALMLALRVGASSSGSAWLAILLGAAGIAHTLDLVLRLRRSPQ